MIKWRDNLDAAKAAAMSKKICKRLFTVKEYRDAKSVFVYMAQGNEPDTSAIIESAVAEGKTVAVPVCLPDTRMLACRYEPGMEMRLNEFGIYEPVELKSITSVDVALMPGLAFDESMHRLGRGAGYYDRWLKLYGGIFKIGLAFEEQIVDSVPYDNMDVKMDIIVTQSRIIRAKK